MHDAGETANAAVHTTAPALPFASAWDLVHPGVSIDAKERARCTDAEVPALCIIREPASPIVPFAEGLWRDHHVAVGRMAAEWMDGGYRGKIRLEPQFPEGQDAKKLPWITAAFASQRAFRDALTTRLGIPARPFSGLPSRLLFFVSVNRTTPGAMAVVAQGRDANSAVARDANSAVAQGRDSGSVDTFYWNIHGSLHRDAKTVEETVVHEAFHLEDQHHKGWSLRTLATIHQAILARCAAKHGAQLDACLAPYSPGTTHVRGGTYYAFHGGNDAREYGAELAVRFFREANLPAGVTSSSPPWKCTRPENGTVWRAYVDEFWDGKDPLPACP